MLELRRTVARSPVSAAKVRRSLSLENLALRHQVAVLQRRSKKPQLENRDRLLWLGLRRLLPERASSLYLVQPATVVKWHRAGFRRYWRRKSQPKGGRPRIDPEVRKLIRVMWNMNSTWGRPRIHAELGFSFAMMTPYSVANSRLGSNRLALRRSRPRFAHRGKTPTARDSLEPFALECLDHIIVLNVQDLRRVLRSYVDYYHSSRTHQSLTNDCPDLRSIELPEKGKVIVFPKVGGLHHLYGRRMAA